MEIAENLIPDDIDTSDETPQATTEYSSDSDKAKNKYGTTRKQEAFCQAYVLMNDFDGMKSLSDAGYEFGGKTPEKAARAFLRQMLRSKNIRKRIEMLTEERNNYQVVDKYWILIKLKTIAETATNVQAKLKALELLGKHLSMFNDNQGEDSKGTDARSAIAAAMAKRTSNSVQTVSVPSQDPLSRAKEILARKEAAS